MTRPPLSWTHAQREALARLAETPGLTLDAYEAGKAAIRADNTLTAADWAAARPAKQTEAV